MTQSEKTKLIAKILMVQLKLPADKAINVAYKIVEALDENELYEL